MISQGDRPDPGEKTQSRASGFTKAAAPSSEPRHRLHRLIDLDERDLIDLQVELEIRKREGR